MAVRDQNASYVFAPQSHLAEPLADYVAGVEKSGVDQRNFVIAANQRDRAPAQPSVTDGFPGVSLDQNVELVGVSHPR
jgi:hypothetical protein